MQQRLYVTHKSQKYLPQSYVWWYTSAIRKQRQEDCEFEVNLDYIVGTLSQKNKTKFYFLEEKDPVSINRELVIFYKKVDIEIMNA
jgi:hypothetical protein